jgi:hypothetical protein
MAVTLKLRRVGDKQTRLMAGRHDQNTACLFVPACCMRRKDLIALVFPAVRFIHGALVLAVLLVAELCPYPQPLTAFNTRIAAAQTPFLPRD